MKKYAIILGIFIASVTIWAVEIEYINPQEKSESEVEVEINEKKYFKAMHGASFIRAVFVLDNGKVFIMTYDDETFRLPKGKTLFALTKFDTDEQEAYEEIDAVRTYLEGQYGG